MPKSRSRGGKQLHSSSSTLRVKEDRAFETWEFAFVALLFFAAVLVRLWGVSKIHSWDEMVYLQNAKVICCGKANYSELAFRPPLLSLLYAGVFRFWHSLYAPCVVTALINALAPVFLYFAGRLSVGRVAALLASVLLALAPFFVGVFPAGFDSDSTGNSLLTDSPALTLIILSFWLLLAAMQHHSLVRFFFGGVALALCVLMRFGSLPCVGMLLLLPLLNSRKLAATLRCLAGFVLGMTPYLLWSRWKFHDPFFTIKAGWIHVEGPTELFTFYFRHAFTIFTPIAVAGLLAAAVWQVYPWLSVAGDDSFRENCKVAPTTIQMYLWGWLIVGFLTYSLIPHKEPRYILPAAAPFLLLSGSGLSLVFALPTRMGRWVGAVCLCSLLLISLLPLRSRFSKPPIDWQVPDEEAAGKLLSAAVPQNTMLYMSFNYPALAYYTSFHIHELADFGPALYRDMEQVPTGEVLVVYREAEEPAQSDIAWCDASHKFVRLAEYPSLVVYRRL